jgi:hypothetical protein
VVVIGLVTLAVHTTCIVHHYGMITPWFSWYIVRLEHPNGPGPWPEVPVCRPIPFSRYGASPRPCDPMALTTRTPFHAHHEWNPLLK